MFKASIFLLAGASCIIAGAAFSIPLLMAAPCIAVMFLTVLKG